MDTTTAETVVLLADENEQLKQRIAALEKEIESLKKEVRLLRAHNPKQ